MEGLDRALEAAVEGDVAEEAEEEVAAADPRIQVEI